MIAQHVSRSQCKILKIRKGMMTKFCGQLFQSVCVCFYCGTEEQRSRTELLVCSSVCFALIRDVLLLRSSLLLLSYIIFFQLPAPKQLSICRSVYLRFLSRVVDICFRPVFHYLSFSQGICSRVLELVCVFSDAARTCNHEN